MPKHNKPLSGGNNWNRQPDKIKHNKKRNNNPWSQNYGQEEESSVYGNNIPSYKYSQPQLLSPEELLSPVDENGQKLANFASRVAVNPWKRQNTFTPPPSRLSFNDDETEAERRLKWELERRGKVGLSYPVYPQNSPLPQYKSNCNCDKEQENDFLGEYSLPRSRTGLSADSVPAWENEVANLQQKNVFSTNKSHSNTDFLKEENFSYNVAIVNNEIVVYVHLLIFGTKATKENAQFIRDSIYNEWNINANIKAYLEQNKASEVYAYLGDKTSSKQTFLAKEFKVILEVTHKYYNLKLPNDKKELEEIANDKVNVNKRNVFICVEKQRDKHSNDNNGGERTVSASWGNSTLLLIHELKNSKTISHEFGHSFAGFGHPKVKRISVKFKESTAAQMTELVLDCRNTPLSVSFPPNTLVDKNLQIDSDQELEEENSTYLQIKHYSAKNKKILFDFDKYSEVTQVDIESMLEGVWLYKNKGDIAKGSLNRAYSLADLPPELHEKASEYLCSSNIIDWTIIEGAKTEDQ